MERDAARFQVFENLEGVDQGAEGAVHFPDDEGVAGLECCKGLSELRALTGNGGHPFILEDALAARFAQCVDLQIEILFGG